MEKYEEMRSNQPIWSWASAVERGEQAYYNVIQDKFEEGMEKGKEEGKEEGMIALLNRLLYKKYHIDAIDWLSTLPAVQLNVVSDYILECSDFDTLKEKVGE